MKKLSRILAGSAFAALAILTACGDEDDNPGKPDGTAGTASGGKGGTTSSGGKGGTTSSGGDTASGGSGNTSNQGGDSSQAGAGGEAPVTSCDVYGERPNGRVEIPTNDAGEIAADLTLTADTIWTMTGQKWVQDGVTLTIEPCTLIEASPKPEAGSLFIMQGAKIEAVGSAAEPIVFTSEDHTLNQAAPWGGIVLLGKAPLSARVDPAPATPTAVYEGLSDDRATYGGDDADDDSGTIAYVRIEFGGDIIIADKEINGLTLAGVGAGTDIHHVMVKDTADDCFEWFGGTVNAHHLICQNAGDDMFDSDEGYRGSLQFLFGRNLVEGSSGDPNGFEWDGNQHLQTAPEETRSAPVASNVTLCGLNEAGTATSRGAVLRKGLASGTTILNAIITGFDHGLDTRDAVGTDAEPLLVWTNSYFDNLTHDTGNAGETDNDGTFDESAWIAATANENTAGELPEGFDCYQVEPVASTAEVAGGTPGGSLDDSAAYVGAFKDASDDWAAGAWVKWE